MTKVSATELAGQAALALDDPFWSAVGEGVLAIALYAALGLVLLVVGFYAIDLAIPGRLSAIIRTERNPNATLLAACGLAAIAFIVVAAIWGAGGRLVEGLISTAIFGLVGIVAQVVASLVFNVLARIDVRRLVHEPTLQPAAVLLGTTHVGIGLITAVAVL